MVMLGSFHALKDECYPLPEAVTNAYNNADILAVECDITSTSEDGEYMKNLMKQMLYNDNTKLSQHISEEAYSALQTYLGYWGMDISALEVYRPWAVSSTLDTLLIQDSGFDSEKGLDNYLLTTAHADGKEIYEVESVDFQMNLLINFSDDIYDLMFRSYEGETKESQKQALEDLYTAWKSGDIETFLEEDNEEELAGYTEEDKKIAEDYNNQMLYDRNKNMAKAAEDLMSQGKKYFGAKVYKTTIPRTIRISEAPSYGQPINFYEPKGKGSEAYMDLAIEFVKNNRPHEPAKRRTKAASAPAEKKNALEEV